MDFDSERSERFLLHGFCKNKQNLIHVLTTVITSSKQYYLLRRYNPYVIKIFTILY